MASMKDIKRRKGSIQSTQQITKAMKLVSTVKLQKAKGRAEQTNPYFNYMYQTVSSMLAKSGNINHPYLKSGETTKKAVVVITSNRGLAGGYNSNILMNYEPTTEEALDMIIPKYVTSLFYGALVEAVASENGARMQAMDSATSNAEEMISDLTLKYNRARQGAITQELTEIIAGASAIS